jgi:hypothetical protein
MSRFKPHPDNPDILVGSTYKIRNWKPENFKEAEPERNLETLKNWQNTHNQITKEKPNMNKETEIIKEAICILRNAKGERDVADAIEIKEDVNWPNVDGEVQDEYYEAFGDVKHYHPDNLD